MEQEETWSTWGSMEASAERSATFLKTGSASKAGKVGREMVGAEVPEPRVTEWVLGMPMAASTAALENLTMMTEEERRESRGEATSWLEAGIQEITRVQQEPEPCNKRWIAIGLCV